MFLSSLVALATATTYTIDASHTYAGFAIEHMMVSEVHGAFTDIAGTIELDPAKILNTKANVTIQVSSVDTRLDKRDEHLRSAEFFDAAKFPTMTFTSKSVRNVGTGTFQLVGDLTIHGVTKEVVLDVKGPTAEYKDPWGNVKIGFSGSTTINRKDFGLTWNSTLESGGLLVGEDVRITLSVEATRG